MKSVKRFARMMALAVAVCMLLTLGVFAAQPGNVWVTASSAEGETAAAVMADCVVTDGVVTMSYDADALTYQGIEVNETYVAMYSVNAETAGEVRIAWVAPGEIEIDGEDWLFRLTFSGTADEDPVLSGTVTGADIVGAPEQGEEPTEPEEGEDPTEDGEETTKPDDGKKPGNQGGSNRPGRPGRPGTGDNSNLTMLVVLALVCVAGIAAVSFVMLRGKKEGKAR